RLWMRSSVMASGRENISALGGGRIGARIHVFGRGTAAKRRGRPRFELKRAGHDLDPANGCKNAADYTRNARALTSAHGVEEFGIVLGLLHLVDQELGGLEVIHRVEQFAQHPD